MRKLGTFLILQVFAAVPLYARGNGDNSALTKVPLKLQLKIGFMSVYIVLGLLFYVDCVLSTSALASFFWLV
jgi:hypothetical protein